MSSANSGVTPEGLAAQLGHDVRPNGDDGWKTTCVLPRNHKNGDRSPSLNIYCNDKGEISWRCLSGCDWQEVTDEITRRGLNPWKQESTTFKPWEQLPVHVFRYLEKDGTWVHNKNRYLFNGEREMCFWHKDGKGGWKRRQEGILYNLPVAHQAAQRGDVLIAVEGETDCDFVTSWGYSAFSLDTGSDSKFYDRHREDLKGAEAIYWLRDHDSPGYKYANRGCEFFTKAGIPCYWVDLPGVETLKQGADIRDWAQAGHTESEFVEAMSEAQLWTAPIPTPETLLTDAEKKKIKKEQRRQDGNVIHLGGQENRSLTSIFRWTDTANGDRFISRYSQTVKYVPGKSWIIWDGKCFRFDDGGDVYEKAKSLLDDIMEEPVESDEALKAKLAWAVKSLQCSGYEKTIRAARTSARIRVSVDTLNGDTRYLNCENGVVDLGDYAKLLPHGPEYLCTRIARGKYIPGLRSETWERFLEQTFPSETLRAYIQRAVGLTVLGQNKEHKVFFCFGFGRNGKTTFLEALGYALGDYFNATGEKMWLKENFRDHKDSFIHLIGSRFMTGGEMPDGSRFDESQIKLVSGGDSIKARDLYEKKNVEFHMSGALWLYGNHKPAVTDITPSFWKRLELIPFTEQVSDEERDMDLPEKLKQDVDAIFTWIVEAAIMYQCHQGKTKLDSDIQVIEATRDYRDDMDSVGGFLDARCSVSPGYNCTASRLYAGYKKWCEEEGVTPLGNKRFKASLEARKITCKRDNSGNKYQGVWMTED